MPRALADADDAIIVDNSASDRHILLSTVAGEILERSPNPPAWFASRWPAIEAALARWGA